jgi:hypothetical protein
MPTRPHPATGATVRRQRGAAALLMIITLVVILTIVLAPRLTLWQVHNAASDRGYQTLTDAKAAILAHAGSPGADAVKTVPLRQVGQISLTPDLPTTPGTTFSGLSKQAPGWGCATSTWVPGLPLIDPNGASAATAPKVRCFGRLPWLSYGLAGPSTVDDEGGAVPWMFVSANLVVGAGCLTLSANIVAYPYQGGCPSAPLKVPFPWLTVVDNRGNVLSAQVAIVLILPGPAVTNAQRRTSPNDRSPTAYLDSLTVTATCPKPCVPGPYNNANYSTNGAWTFVDAPPSTALGPPPAYYGQPFAFNDRLIYITASEYFAAMTGHH